MCSCEGFYIVVPKSTNLVRERANTQHLIYLYGILADIPDVPRHLLIFVFALSHHPYHSLTLIPNQFAPKLYIFVVCIYSAHFGLPSTADVKDMSWKKPISVNFEIPYFTVSGIQVRYLKIIEKSGYQALPWVRYFTQNGDSYQLRMA
jgi:hypothetical protein